MKETGLRICLWLRSSSAERLEIFGTYFVGRALVNQTEREYETETVILSNQNPFHTLHYAALDSYPLSDKKLAIGLSSSACKSPIAGTLSRIRAAVWFTPIDHDLQYSRRRRGSP